MGAKALVNNLWANSRVPTIEASESFPGGGKEARQVFTGYCGTTRPLVIRLAVEVDWINPKDLLRDSRVE